MKEQKLGDLSSGGIYLLDKYAYKLFQSFGETNDKKHIIVNVLHIEKGGKFNIKLKEVYRKESFDGYCSFISEEQYLETMKQICMKANSAAPDFDDIIDMIKSAT